VGGGGGGGGGRGGGYGNIKTGHISRKQYTHNEIIECGDFSRHIYMLPQKIKDIKCYHQQIYPIALQKSIFSEKIPKKTFVVEIIEKCVFFHN
jgi:hypothetical protein